MSSNAALILQEAEEAFNLLTDIREFAVNAHFQQPATVADYVYLLGPFTQLMEDQILESDATDKSDLNYLQALQGLQLELS